MISLARNRLLAAVPEQDFERLMVGLGSVHLCSGDILYHAGEEIRHVYFPDQGLISLVATMMDGATVETGIVGNEGMMGVPVLLGASSAPYRAIVQVEGQAWRMKADVLKYEMLRGGALRKRLLLYTQALMTQMSQMAACNCLHTVEERLCSLLLMIDDRHGLERILSDARNDRGDAGRATRRNHRRRRQAAPGGCDQLHARPHSHPGQAQSGDVGLRMLPHD